MKTALPFSLYRNGDARPIFWERSRIALWGDTSFLILRLYGRLSRQRTPVKDGCANRRKKMKKKIGLVLLLIAVTAGMAFAGDTIGFEQQPGLGPITVTKVQAVTGGIRIYYTVNEPKKITIVARVFYEKWSDPLLVPGSQRTLQEKEYKNSENLTKYKKGDNLSCFIAMTAPSNVTKVEIYF